MIAMGRARARASNSRMRHYYRGAPRVSFVMYDAISLIIITDIDIKEVIFYFRRIF